MRYWSILLYPVLLIIIVVSIVIDAIWDCIKLLYAVFTFNLDDILMQLFSLIFAHIIYLLLPYILIFFPFDPIWGYIKNEYDIDTLFHKCIFIKDLMGKEEKTGKQAANAVQNAASTVCNVTNANATKDTAGVSHNVSSTCVNISNTANSAAIPKYISVPLPNESSAVSHERGNNYYSIDNHLMINGHRIEYDDTNHIYRVDGVQVFSVSAIVQYTSQKMGLDDYKYIDPAVLKRAAAKGTVLHKEIENYEKNGVYSDSIEFSNYLKIKEKNHFKVLDSEKIALFCDDNDIPIFCGRIDMLISMDHMLGINDIKRTMHLYPKKVQLQLNLYRLAYIQSYGENIEFLSCTRLRELNSEFVQLPIDESATKQCIKSFAAYYGKKYSIE